MKRTLERNRGEIRRMVQGATRGIARGRFWEDAVAEWRDENAVELRQDESLEVLRL